MNPSITFYFMKKLIFMQKKQCILYLILSHIIQIVACSSLNINLRQVFFF